MSYEWSCESHAAGREAERVLGELSEEGWEVITVAPFTHDVEDGQSVLVVARRKKGNPVPDTEKAPVPVPSVREMPAEERPTSDERTGLIATLQKLCTEKFVLHDRTTNKPGFNTHLMHEWFRCDFPGYSATATMKQFTNRDLREAIFAISDDAKRRNTDYQKARYSYRLVRQAIEDAHQLTTYEVGPQVTVAQLRDWTKQLREEMERRQAA